MTECAHDTIFHDVVVGDERNPRLRTIVECDGNRATTCGYRDVFRDFEGDEHTPREFWVTAHEATKYHAAHLAWSRMEGPDRAAYEARIGLVDPYAEVTA